MTFKELPLQSVFFRMRTRDDGVKQVNGLALRKIRHQYNDKPNALTCNTTGRKSMDRWFIGGEVEVALLNR